MKHVGIAVKCVNTVHACLLCGFHFSRQLQLQKDAPIDAMDKVWFDMYE